MMAGPPRANLYAHRQARGGSVSKPNLMSLAGEERVDLLAPAL